MNTASGRGAAPFRTSWFKKANSRLRNNISIYPPAVRGDDSSMQLAMLDYYFEPVIIPVTYKTRRGARQYNFGSRQYRSPRVYNYG